VAATGEGAADVSWDQGQGTQRYLTKALKFPDKIFLRFLIALEADRK
jgi:hypothetical protein